MKIWVLLGVAVGKVLASMHETSIDMDQFPSTTIDLSGSEDDSVGPSTSAGDKKSRKVQFTTSTGAVHEDSIDVSFDESSLVAEERQESKWNQDEKKHHHSSDKNGAIANDYESSQDMNSIPFIKSKDEKHAFNAIKSDSAKVLESNTDDSFVNYQNFERNGRSVVTVFIITLVLFFIMYAVSSDYLTPSLAHLSAACNMSPDLAGLTFLAFGNGAPDLFTALSGADEAPEMILSSSIGAGLFIFTVVFGLVICFAKDVSSNTSLLGTTPRVKIGRGTFWRNLLMYMFCLVVLATFVLGKVIHFWQALGLILCYCLYLTASIATFYLRKSKKSSKQQDAEDEDATTRESMLLLEIERIRFKFKQRSLADKIAFVCDKESGWSEMDLIGRSLWLLTSPLRLVLCLTIPPLPDPSLLEAPEKFVAHTVAVRVLIPFTTLCSVPLMAYITGIWERITESLGLAMTVACMSVLAVSLSSIFILCMNSIVLASNCMEARLVEKVPLYAVAVYSFACCIGWIYVASNELVAALLCLGDLIGVSPTIMGSLMLAWGNSIGDLIADIALARNGIPQTAITAIFSGPIQNVLLTLGCSFLWASHAKPVELNDLSKDVMLTLLTLIGVLFVSMIMIPGYFVYRIPRWYGLFLIGVYLLYVPLSVLLSM